jgi:transposase-like protein
MARYQQKNISPLCWGFFICPPITHTQLKGDDPLVAQVANSDHKSSTKVASGRISNKGKEHRGDNPQPNRRRNVTAEEKERIRELYQTGAPVKDIVQQFPWSQSTIERYLGAPLRRPRWTDDDYQVLVDGYFEKQPVKKIAQKLGRSPTAVRVAMCRYRKAVKSDPKKKRVMGVMTYVLKVMRKADIFRDFDSGISSISLPTQ